MLPFGIGEGVVAGFNPVVGGFLSTGRAKSGFAGLFDFDALFTFWAGVNLISEKAGFTHQHF